MEAESKSGINKNANCPYCRNYRGKRSDNVRRHIASLHADEDAARFLPLEYVEEVPQVPQMPQVPHDE